jgi:hypothetical protein
MCFECAFFVPTFCYNGVMIIDCITWWQLALVSTASVCVALKEKEDNK